MYNIISGFAYVNLEDHKIISGKTFHQYNPGTTSFVTLTIRPNVLKAGAWYRFILEVNTVGDTIGIATVDVYVRVGPVSGTLKTDKDEYTGLTVITIKGEG